MQETAQPAKPVAKPQTARTQQAQPAQQNVSAPNTSAEESKEVIDEKASQPNAVGAPVDATIPSIADAEQPRLGDTTTETQGLLSGAPITQMNPEDRQLEQNRQPMAPAEPVTGPPHIDTSSAAGQLPISSMSPAVQVQAPTPVAMESDDALIHDRTPEQEARDKDIEMTDVGPSVPISTNEAQQVIREEEEDGRRRSRDVSDAEQSHVLPPPPPLPLSSEKQAQTGDGQVVSQQTNAMNPGEGQKWLLPPLSSELRGRKCLVLDLDETLVHSSFKVGYA